MPPSMCFLNDTFLYTVMNCVRAKNLLPQPTKNVKQQNFHDDCRRCDPLPSHEALALRGGPSLRPRNGDIYSSIYSSSNTMGGGDSQQVQQVGRVRPRRAHRST
jgi:hypothetical protein